MDSPGLFDDQAQRGVRDPSGSIRGPRARARRTDPDTSREAAASLSLDHLSRSKRAVLTLMRGFPDGIHDAELVRRYKDEDWEPRQTDSSVRSRRSELVRLGFVREAGDIRVPGARGRTTRHTVWQAISERGTFGEPLRGEKGSDE